MPIKDHAKSDYSQGHKEHYLRSWHELPGRITYRRKTRTWPRSSHEGSPTGQDHERTLLPPSSLSVSNGMALPPSSLGGYSLYEESLGSFQIADTLLGRVLWQRSTPTPEKSPEENARLEYVQEDLSPHWSPALLASDPNLQSDTEYFLRKVFRRSHQVKMKICRRFMRSLFFENQRGPFLKIPSSTEEHTKEITKELTKELTGGLADDLTEELYHHSTIKLRIIFPRTINWDITRNLKYWRRPQDPRSQKKKPASTNVNISRTLPEGEFDEVNLRTISHYLIAEWKTRAGKAKDWRTGPMKDLLKKDNLRGRESYGKRHMPFNAIDWLGRNMLHASVFTAIGLHQIPRDMLRSYRLHAAESDSKAPSYLRHGTKRRLKCDCDKKKPPYLELEKKAKRERAIDIKNIISEGILFQRVAGYSDSEVADTAFETDECPLSGPQSDSLLPTKLVSKSVVFAESSTRATDGLSIAYESRIGAIVGGRFVLQGLIATKLCYDWHAANDLCTDTVYTAKVYSIRGTKGNERKYRLTSLKRNASKASCIASIDQGGRKWLFFSGGIEHLVETGSTDDASAWHGEEQYQHHFPLLSPQHPAGITAYTPSRKTYASCVQEVTSESNDRIAKEEASRTQDDQSPSDNVVAKRKEKVRDRQRNKRKQKRAAEAAARRATNDEAALSEVTGTSVDKNCPASISHEDLEPAALSIARLPDEATLPKQKSTSMDQSRAASIFHQDPTLETIPTVGLFAGAEFERFLCNLDEETSQKSHPEVDEMFWKRLIQGPAETFKHRCLDVFAGYRTLAHVCERSEVVDGRTVQGSMESWEIKDVIRLIEILRIGVEERIQHSRMEWYNKLYASW